MIVSHIDGRIRVVDKYLKNSGKVSSKLSGLRRKKGINSVRHTTAIGSLLLEYDSDIIDKGEIVILLISTFYKKLSMKRVDASTPNNYNRLKRKVINWSLILTLATSVFSIYSKRKLLHIESSYLFIGLLSYHIYLNRRAL